MRNSSGISMKLKPPSPVALLTPIAMQAVLPQEFGDFTVGWMRC